MNKARLVMLMAVLAGAVALATATATQAQSNYEYEVTWVFDGHQWVLSPGPTHEQRITELEAKVDELEARLDSRGGISLSEVPSDPPPNEVLPPPSNARQYVQVDKASYTLQDEIKVNGQLPDACPPTRYDLEGVPVEYHLALIYITPELGNSMYVSQLTCDANFDKWDFIKKTLVNADGSFSDSVEVEGDFPRGTYHAKITPPMGKFFDYKAFYSEPFTIE